MINQILIFKFVLLLILLSLSAFFSASETALFSLDSIKIKRLSQSGKDTSLILKLLENPLRCLTSLLLGNTLVNIAISALITSLLIENLGVKAVGISIAVTTFILLMFGEVTPKTIAIYNNEKLSSLFCAPLYLFSRIISPFLFLATKVCDGIISYFHMNLKKEPTLTEEEFRTVMEVGHRHGVVGKSEKEMVVSILELTTTTAQEIMTPRMDTKAISSAWGQEKIITHLKSSKHSKVLVYKDSFDNILGMIYVRDVFLDDKKPFMEYLKPVMFVPATKKIDELIKEFYKQEIKMAVVVDEHGGTSGLVTLEDILEEIFGEMRGGHQIKESLIEVLKPDTYRISGKAPVYRVNEDCILQIPSGDYDTIAGFLLFILGKIPAEGERIEAAGGVFTIEKIAGRRIRSVILEKK